MTTRPISHRVSMTLTCSRGVRRREAGAMCLPRTTMCIVCSTANRMHSLPGLLHVQTRVLAHHGLHLELTATALRTLQLALALHDTLLSSPAVNPLSTVPLAPPIGSPQVAHLERTELSTPQVTHLQDSQLISPHWNGLERYVPRTYADGKPELYSLRG